MRSEDGLSFCELLAKYLICRCFHILENMVLMKNTTHLQTHIYFYRQHLQRWQIRYTQGGRIFEHRFVVYIFVTLFHISVIHLIFNLPKTTFSSSMHKIYTTILSTSTRPRKFDDDYFPFKRKSFISFYLIVILCDSIVKFVYFCLNYRLRW